MSENYQQRTLENRMQSIKWDEDSPLTLDVETRQGAMRARHGRFVGGRADGVEIVRLETGTAAIHVLPSRGMSIWNIDCGPTRYGWRSPIDGPVHPSLVPIFDPSGLGWLEGFDELLVRCGLESNGAPEHDESGKLIYPLHGRIGNLPADGLEIEFDEASGRLELVGDVRESRLFFSNLQMRSRVRVHAGSNRVEILDEVVNLGSSPASMQLLYHINIGQPILEAGAKLVAPIEELAPKDSLSAGEMETWNQYDGPQSGYTERVYFAKLKCDEANLSTSVLHNAEASQGLAVTQQTKALPRFVLWKNTADVADGYVTGLEPATNFPNTRSYEASQGRVVELGPDQTASFRVTLEPLTNAEEVEQAVERVQKIAGDEPPTIHTTPRPGWSPGA